MTDQSDSSEPLSPHAASVVTLREEMGRKIDRMERNNDRISKQLEDLSNFFQAYIRGSPLSHPIDPMRPGPSHQYIPPTPQPPPPLHHSAPSHGVPPPNPNHHSNEPSPPPPPPSPRLHHPIDLEEEDRMSLSHGSDVGYRERRGRRREDDDRGLKIDLPEFEGSTNGDDYVDWVHEMERVFEYKDYSDEKRFKLTILKFKGYATHWWRKVKRQRENDGKSDIKTWSKLKKVMDKRFLPNEYIQELYHKLHGLKQEKKTVGEYIREFELLMIRCDLPEAKEHTIARFISGLNRDLANVVELQAYKTLDDVYKLATKVEKQRASTRTTVFRPYLREGFGPKGGIGGTKSEPSKATTMEKEKGKTEMVKPMSSSRPYEPRRDVTKSKCFKCHGIGHFKQIVLIGGL